MSKGADNLKTLVKEYMRQYRNIKVTFESKAIWDLRWDIMIKTKLPIVFEFQGAQHYKFTQFFHKDIEGSKKAKEYDNLKKQLHNNKKVILIEVDNEKLTFLELCDLLMPYKDVITEENNELETVKRGTQISSRINNKEKRNVSGTKRSESYFSICSGTGYKQK